MDDQDRKDFDISPALEAALRRLIRKELAAAGLTPPEQLIETISQAWKEERERSAVGGLPRL